ncbi:F0F1 ATP synthase subunit epsilon [Cardinium endosymbiont of Culicoides punctatus]|uniref:F0F1 ATP synthase subunit epsilon n=1 Tax=Cardinium endosymbiont of Culicoides punctatus TaxID=2304601 RepID=UPI0010584CFE|nr:F0F1 ATP synthase subunit epsilon [Cardinium endosymbiont of Culicoides punctatus]TDG95289.1 ATP synthase epsilon chain [Cardinium endosymbiont of Culicoides punctatus]
MNLSIMTSESRIFDGVVNSVIFPGELGPFQVLANHAPTLSSLVSGNITYMTKGISSSIAIKSGFAQIAQNQISVVCEAEEINSINDV